MRCDGLEPEREDVDGDEGCQHAEATQEVEDRVGKELPHGVKRLPCDGQQPHRYSQMSTISVQSQDYPKCP